MISAAQGLLAEVGGSHDTVQSRAGQAAEADDHAHQAPIGAVLMLVAVGGKLAGYVAVGAQAHGASVQQVNPEPFQSGGELRAVILRPCKRKASARKLRQALARIAVGGRRTGKQVAGEFAIEPVGAAAPSIGEGRVQAVVGVQTLKEQIPEGDQRGKEAVVEGLVLQGGQLEQGGVGKELEEEGQQLGRGKAGVDLGGLWWRGVLGGSFSMHIILYAYIDMLYCRL